MRLFRLHCYWDSIRSVLPVYVLRTYLYVYQYAYVFCTIGCQYSTLNRLFGCVFLVWRHHSRKVNKSSVRSFRRIFLQFSYCLMFLNIQIDLIILKTFDQKFTLTTKKSLHIIFKHNYLQNTEYSWHQFIFCWNWSLYSTSVNTDTVNQVTNM